MGNREDRKNEGGREIERRGVNREGEEVAREGKVGENRGVEK